MMKISIRRLAIGGLAATSLLAIPTAANASGGYDGRGGYDGGNRSRAVSYINPDTGAATTNPDVNADSSCFSPDQFDKQMFSPTGTATKNVHNDACFLDERSNKVDGPASFESRGVGFISACPDPDGAGPKVAILSDRNSDGRNELCFQSGYQMKNAAGDLEFHARLNNNTAAAGTQYVTWCSDADHDGCSDEWNKSSIRIDWSADGTAAYSDNNDGSTSNWGSYR